MATSEDAPKVGDPLPTTALHIIDNYQSGGIEASDCVTCSSSCCAHPGFAILENVEVIYELYREGELVRTDYEFPPGMSFREFVMEYFDVYRHDVAGTDPVESIVFFHMRSLSADGHTISIPPMATIADYHRAREAIFRANPWMNTGCIFLSHQLKGWPDEDGVAERHCTLHSAEAGTQLTAKPIDCVFHTCNTPRDARKPNQEQSEAWFAELAQQWPNSVERFRQLVTDSDTTG